MPTDNITYALKQSILRKYPTEVSENAVKLCLYCKYHNLNGILCTILPVTSKGEQCPYFERK